VTRELICALAGSKSIGPFAKNAKVRGQNRKFVKIEGSKVQFNKKDIRSYKSLSELNINMT
jgi:hypothetical protein